MIRGNQGMAGETSPSLQTDKAMIYRLQSFLYDSIIACVEQTLKT
jgi:hypothetical protein